MYVSLINVKCLAESDIYQC